MHTPVTVPRQSLYHSYTVYPHTFPSDPARSNGVVTIVGGGPIGLVASLILARHGIKNIVLLSEQQVSEGSRGLVYTRRSMEILKVAGVADRIMEKALSWTSGNSFYSGKRVFRMENPVDPQDSYPPLNNLQQNHLETYLVEEAARQPLIELRWGNHLTSFSQDEHEVTLVVDTPEGEYTYKTPWLIAADGARSAVRQSMGLTMEGNSYEGRFVIVDIRIDLPLPTERLAYFSPDWNPGNTILLHKEPDNIWRFDYQLPAHVSNEEALDLQNINQAVNAQLKMMGYEDKQWELDWYSVYSARALTLPEYVHNRILFAGDSAHMLPIFGVRGANTGFQDVMDLCWKLAATIKGWGSSYLLNSYTHDRVGAAMEIIDEAGKSTRFMAPPTDGFRLLRDATLSLSLKHEFVRPLFHWRTSRAHVYRSSPVNSIGDDNQDMIPELENGAPIPNLKLSGKQYLYDELGLDFNIVYFGNEESLPDSLQKEVNELRSQGVPFKVIVLSSENTATAGADKTFRVDAQLLQSRYGASQGQVYLVRPDHHICGRWKKYVPGSLENAFQKFIKKSA
ncbi:oxidoreductase [Advenella faeciporci]|uniref:Oxidoreductase n=1 Tax=Advenella faeciporci TaxID=797535 RepID=A0A918MWP2_9BURK|nr:FAD-dependent monooxygenase [Advenella faeciporci]GGW76806.1 oxidoreductase [Advenella faeciporci]